MVIMLISSRRFPNFSFLGESIFRLGVNWIRTIWLNQFLPILFQSRIHQDKSFHCEVCNVCLDKRLEGNHKCRPDSGHDECCICLEVSVNEIAWENSGDISRCYWLLSTEIPYRWPVTRPIWVVRLIGRSAWKIFFNHADIYVISALVLHTSFLGETSSGVAKCRLFRQANYERKLC